MRASNDIPFRYKPISFYFTPRAALIKYLNDDKYSSKVKWIVRGRIFEFHNYDGFVETWAKEIKLSCLTTAKQFVASDLLGSIEMEVAPTQWDPRAKWCLATKSTDRRLYVHDLRAGKLSEWLIKLLLEYTRIDWLTWVDQKKLEFKMLNISAIGKEFFKRNCRNMNGREEVVKNFAIKMQLMGYCRTGILIETDRSKHHYQFNKEWYDKEITKLGSDIEYFKDSITRIADNELELYL